MVQEAMEAFPDTLDHDLESLYSEDDECESPVFGITFPEEEADSDEVDSDDSDDSTVTHYHDLYHVVPCFSTQKVMMPHVKMEVLPSKYAKPIEVIGFVDTGSAQTMLNPDILKGIWKEQPTHFTAADGKVFTTNLISRQQVGIKFFPDCIVWVKAVGTHLAGKDALIGMDVISQANKLRISASGLSFKKNFKPFTTIQNLFLAEKEEHPLIQQFQHLFTESHAEFKHSSPLWKNSNFFVRLPFKMNEDINPTKATHPGMSPSDLTLAKEECAQLLQQGLIEPANSEWACQAFYVNKRSEQVL